MGNLDNRRHWLHIINLMEHWLRCWILSSSASKRKLSIFISFSSLKGFIKKNGMLFDRHNSLPSKLVKGIEQSPRVHLWNQNARDEPCKRLWKTVEFSLKCLTYWTCFAERCCLSFSVWYIKPQCPLHSSKRTHRKLAQTRLASDAVRTWQRLSNNIVWTLIKFKDHTWNAVFMDIADERADDNCWGLKLISCVKVFRINPEFRVLRLTFHKVSLINAELGRL